MKIKVPGANLSGLNENVDIGQIISHKKKKKHNVVEVESITNPEPPLKSLKKSKKLYKQPDQDFALRETNTVEPETKLEESITIKKKKRHNELKEFEDSSYIASNESITMFGDSNAVNTNESSKKKKKHKKDFQGTELYQNQCAEGTNKPKSKHNNKQNYIALLSPSDCENSLNRKKRKSEKVHVEGILDLVVKSKPKKKCLEYQIDMISEQTEDQKLSKSKRKKKCLEYSIDTTSEQTKDVYLSKSEQNEKKKKNFECSIDTSEQTEDLLSKSKQKKKKKKILEYLIDTSEQTEDLLSKSKRKKKKKKCSEYSINTTSEQSEDLLSTSEQNKKKKKGSNDLECSQNKGSNDLLGYQEKASPKRSVTFEGSVIDNEPESSPKKMKRKDLKKLEEDMAYQPTEEEIEESLKMKNKKATVSKREIKRDKLKHKQEEERLNSELSMQQRGISYLSLWKHNRNEWKFEKLRQVWLINNMLSEQKIPEKNWETLLEYMSPAKGQVRKTIIESAMKVIQETELWSERKQEAEDKDEEIEEPQPSQLKYRRARELLQCLQE